MLHFTRLEKLDRDKHSEPINKLQRFVRHYDDPITNEPYRTGRLSTVDPLALTSFDKGLFKLKTLFSFLQNKMFKRGGQWY